MEANECPGLIASCGSFYLMVSLPLQDATQLIRFMVDYRLGQRTRHFLILGRASGSGLEESVIGFSKPVQKKESCHCSDPKWISRQLLSFGKQFCPDNKTLSTFPSLQRCSGIVRPVASSTSQEWIYPVSKRFLPDKSPFIDWGERKYVTAHNSILKIECGYYFTLS